MLLECWTSVFDGIRASWRIVENLHHVDSSQSLSEENEVDVLAVTFAMAFSDTRNDVNYSNSEAMNPDIFNRLYYIRDGSAQQDACDFIREVLNKCVEVDPALANAWRFQFTPDTLHCDVPGCLYHHQVCAASNNAIEYFLDLALTSDDGKTHFTTIQQAINGHAQAAYVGYGYRWATPCPVHHVHCH